MNVETMRSKLDKEEDLNILNWLAPVDYATQQRDYFRRQEPGTGQWFLKSNEYKEWMKTRGETLFCPGIPGAGKTILTAIVIDDIHSQFQSDASVGIAYLYCDFRRQHEQNIESLLSNLLKQLSQEQASIPGRVQALYKEYRDKPRRPSRNDISSALSDVIAVYSKSFIIIDALDECDGCRTELLDEIFGLQERAGANIFATSRYNPKIYTPKITKKFKKAISLEIRAKDEDVQTYLAGNIARLPSFVLSKTDLLDDIKATISRAVDGMYVRASYYQKAYILTSILGSFLLGCI